MKYADYKAVYLEKKVSLEDWRKSDRITPKFKIQSYESVAKVRSADDFIKFANELKPTLEKYTGRQSLWSNKIILCNQKEFPAKMWNCDIRIWQDAPLHILLHELLHSCSISHFGVEAYRQNATAEELAVQFLSQEIAALENIPVIKSGYDSGVELLRRYKAALNLTLSDLDFAAELMKKPPAERFDWLESLN